MSEKYLEHVGRIAYPENNSIGATIIFRYFICPLTCLQSPRIRSLRAILLPLIPVITLHLFHYCFLFPQTNHRAAFLRVEISKFNYEIRFWKSARDILHKLRHRACSYDDKRALHDNVQQC